MSSQGPIDQEFGAPPAPSDDIKRISVEEFRQGGYLQELNRRFLHPLGLALEIMVDADGQAVSLGGIWDYRDDPEGMNYGPGMIDPEKMVKVADEWAEKAMVRAEKLGYVIQRS